MDGDTGGLNDAVTEGGNVGQPTSKRSIQEFWIDFLLEEELSCSPEFAENFLGRIGLKEARIEQVVHSQSDQFGETDVFAMCRLPNGTAAAVLIEDKITAAFQTDQAQRYRSRGENGIADARWSEFRTVLVAPEQYVGTSTHGFDVAVSLEDLLEWVCPNDPLRGEFKRSRLKRAIEKKSSTGIQVVDEDMTRYRAWYSQAIEEFNALHCTSFVSPPPRLAWYDDNWIQWKSTALPAGCEFRHMSRSGIIDLTFKNISIDRLQWLGRFLRSEMSLEITGRHKQHTAIQIRVPKISDFNDLGAAAPIVDAALVGAKRLEDLAVKYLDDLRSSGLQ